MIEAIIYDFDGVIGDSEVLIETPFQSGSELRSVGDQVGVDLPPQRMLFLPA